MVASSGQDQRKTPQTKNLILLSLPDDAFKRLEPDMEPVKFRNKQIIYHSGVRITHLYFISTGLATLLKTMQDGRTVEIGAVNNHGIIGLNAIIGAGLTISESIIRIPGCGVRIKADIFRDEFEKNFSVRHLIYRYSQCYMQQIAQNVACNRLHSLEQRCCRWLLTAHDSAQSDSFPLTQEFLAMMLGVQRSGVSIVANALQRASFIRYRRGHLSIVDRTALEARACECYAEINSQIERIYAI